MQGYTCWHQGISMRNQVFFLSQKRYFWASKTPKTRIVWHHYLKAEGSNFDIVTGTITITNTISGEPSIAHGYGLFR